MGLALAQQATGADETGDATCPAAVEALINAITAAQVDTDAKLKTKCETIMNNDAYTEACKAALNAKVKSHANKDCPAAPPPTTAEPEPNGSAMTSLSAAVAMAVVLPLLRQ